MFNYVATLILLTHFLATFALIKYHDSVKVLTFYSLPVISEFDIRKL